MNRRDFAKSLIIPGIAIVGVAQTPISTPEGEEQPEDTVVTTIHTHGKTFALGFRIDKEALANDAYYKENFEALTKLTNALANATRNTIAQEYNLPPWRVKDIKV